MPEAEPKVEVSVEPTTTFESDNTTTNDLLLAQMLQLEFDKENDEYVKSLEKNYNGTSKGKSFKFSLIILFWESSNNFIFIIYRSTSPFMQIGYNVCRLTIIRNGQH